MLRGAIYGLTAAAIWGGMYVVSDIVLETIPPFTLLSIRLILGAIVLYFIIRQQGSFRIPPRSTLMPILGVGMIGFGVSLGAQFVGTDKSTAVNGAIVTSASPAFILIFAALILREKLTITRIMAVLLASIGVIIVIDLRQADFGSDTFLGDVILAMAALTWGLYSVLIRHISTRLDTLMLTLIAFLGGLAISMPATVLELSQRSIGDIDVGVIGGVLYLGLISTAGAMWLWNRAFALVDASVASLFFFAQPLTGAILATLFLDQALTINLIVGGLVIASGVLLSILSPSRRPDAKVVQST
jgi:drug/metabolite transporter (DMT)-like permease